MKTVVRTTTHPMTSSSPVPMKNTADAAKDAKAAIAKIQ